MTRRVFLLLVFEWLLFWRYKTLAGIRFRRIREGDAPVRYVFIHGNEETARHVLREHMKRHKGTAYLVTGDERYVKIRSALIDPNRLFSREGASRSLVRLNPGWTGAAIDDVLEFLDRKRPELIEALTPPPGGLTIAVHNNSEGYSVTDEIPISDRVSLKQPAQPNEFFLCTNPADFEKLAVGPYNAVLQNLPGEDDGSLSRLAARTSMRYCNLEVGLGKEQLQATMLEWLVKTLT